MIDRIRVKAGGRGTPVPTLRLRDAVAITVGIVVGAGIFRTPSLVAANASSEGVALLIWLGGGVVQKYVKDTVRAPDAIVEKARKLMGM